MKIGKMLKKLTALLLAMIFIFIAAACGNTSTNNNPTPGNKESPGSNNNSAAPTNQPAASTVKDTLKFAMDQEPATMDPQNMTDGASYGVTANLYDTLVWVSDTGEIEPLLAKGWKISDDGLVYTFELEKEVYFQNGEHFTANDVQYTLERALASKSTSAATSFIESTKAVDDYTLEVTLKYPYGPALSCFGSQFLRIVNKKAVEAAGDSFSTSPGLAGTGPYKFESWVSGQKLTLVANEDYWRGAPKIKRVEIYFIPDETTKTVAVETGEIDMGTIPFQSVAKVEANENLDYKVIAGQTVNYFGFNTKSKPFDNELVRKAIAYCCDKEEMLLVSRESPAGGVLTATPVKEDGFGFNPDLQLYPKDIEKAKQLLTEAGYSNGFDATIYVGNNAFRIAIATYMQACMKEIGINVKIETMEQAALLEDIKAGKTEMFIMGANAFASDADLYLYNMYHSSGSVNYTHVSDEWLDKKLEEARATVDTTKRAALYKEITQYIYDKVYDIPNFWITNVWAYNKDLVIDVVPSASRYYFYGMYFK